MNYDEWIRRRIERTPLAFRGGRSRILGPSRPRSPEDEAFLLEMDRRRLQRWLAEGILEHPEPRRWILHL